MVGVEISQEGGESYQEAELTYAPGADRWTLWRHVWRPQRIGTHLIHVRCRSESGLRTEEEYPENRIPYVGGMWLLVECSKRFEHGLKRTDAACFDSSLQEKGAIDGCRAHLKRWPRRFRERSASALPVFRPAVVFQI